MLGICETSLIIEQDKLICTSILFHCLDCYRTSQSQCHLTRDWTPLLNLIDWVGPHVRFHVNAIINVYPQANRSLESLDAKGQQSVKNREQIENETVNCVVKNTNV